MVRTSKGMNPETNPVKSAGRKAKDAKTMNAYYLTNDLAVDSHLKVALADLCYVPDSDRDDDRGRLMVSPVVKFPGGDAPLGLLALYCTTNGDPVQVGLIEDGEITWLPEFADDAESWLWPVLRTATWEDPGNPDDWYGYAVQDAIPAQETE